MNVEATLAGLIAEVIRYRQVALGLTALMDSFKLEVVAFKSVDLHSLCLDSSRLI